MYQIEPRQLTPLLIVAEVDHDLPAGLLRFHRIDRLAAEARRLAGLGLLACKLYVKTPAGRKDEHATAGLAKDSLMVRAIKEIKNAVPELRVGTEVCACAYHVRGECVLVGENGVDNAATHRLVAQMSVLHADAGADVVVAGLTHDGSIRAMRTALDESGHGNVQIQGSVQLRTGFYGPYRKMMGTEPEAGETFRAHQPQTDRDAVMKVARRHVEEGSALLSVQPALLGAPLLAPIKTATGVPVAAYSVSTELNLVRGSSPDLWLGKGQESILAEYYTMLLQAGADQVQSYVAGDLAAWLGDH
jgi:porphobilinogen synthase